MKTVSVIIPVFNSKDYLKNCIESISAVNAHTKTTIIGEIVLVDDGSTDGSGEICDSFVNGNVYQGCSIQVIHQENKGVSAARNRGLSIASGDFVLFIDSDDTVDSSKLAELLFTAMQDQPFDMIVFGMSFEYYSGNRIYRRELLLPPFSGQITHEELENSIVRIFSTNMISSLCNKLIRKSIIDSAVILLREEMFLYEDLEFSLRLMAKCKSLYFSQEPIYRYRQSSDEGNAARRLKRIEHIPEIVDKIEDALIPLGGSEDILLSLYLVLAREKISLASKKETDTVCADFKNWVDSHKLFNRVRSNEYAMLLYGIRSLRLLIKRTKTRIRHKVAVSVKKMIGDFRTQ